MQEVGIESVTGILQQVDQRDAPPLREREAARVKSWGLLRNRHGARQEITDRRSRDGKVRTRLINWLLIQGSFCTDIDSATVSATLREVP